MTATRREIAMVALAAVASYLLGRRATSGFEIVMMLGGLAGACTIFLRPRLGILGLFYVTGFLSPRAGHVEGLSINLELAEMLAIAVLGGWVLTLSVRARARPVAPDPFFTPVVMILVGALVGAVIGLEKLDGADRLFLTGEVKALSFYVLILAIGSICRPDPGWLETWVIRAGVGGSLYTLYAAATGRFAAKVTGVLTLDVQSEVQRLRLPILPVVFVATLLLVHRVVLRGAMPGRLGALASCLFTLALSFNRSTWVPLALCVAAYLWLRPGPREALRGLRWTLAVSAVSAVVLATAAAGMLGPTAAALVLRVTSISPAVAEDSSYSYRQAEVDAVLAAIRANPLTGIGLAQPYGIVDLVRDPATGERVWVPRLYTHNSFLGAWLRFGILGAGGFVLLIWRVVREVGRSRASSRTLYAASRRMSAGIAALGIAIQSLFQTNLFNRSTLLALACALALAATDDELEGPPAEAALGDSAARAGVAQRAA